MPWYIVLIIALPLLFVVGMCYNAYKEQRRLEKNLLPKLLKARQEELERWRQEGRDLGELAAKYAYDKPDDITKHAPVSPRSTAAQPSAAAPSLQSTPADKR